MDSAVGYEPASMGVQFSHCVPIKLILAIDGDASCERSLGIKTWLVATKTGIEWEKPPIKFTMQSWLGLSNKGISYSCVARYYLFDDRAPTATIKVIFMSSVRFRYCKPKNFAVSSTGRAKEYLVPWYIACFLSFLL